MHASKHFLFGRIMLMKDLFHVEPNMEIKCASRHYIKVLTSMIIILTF